MSFRIDNSMFSDGRYFNSIGGVDVMTEERTLLLTGCVNLPAEPVGFVPQRAGFLLQEVSETEGSTWMYEMDAMSRKELKALEDAGDVLHVIRYVVTSAEALNRALAQYAGQIIGDEVERYLDGLSDEAREGALELMAQGGAFNLPMFITGMLETFRGQQDKLDFLAGIETFDINCGDVIAA